MPPPDLTLEILDYRVSVLEEDRRRFLAALETLVLLGASVGETQRAMNATNGNAERLGKWIEAVDKRVQGLEVEAPVLRLTSKWVIGGVIGTLSGLASLIAIALWALVTNRT